MQRNIELLNNNMVHRMMSTLTSGHRLSSPLPYSTIQSVSHGLHGARLGERNITSGPTSPSRSPVFRAAVLRRGPRNIIFSSVTSSFRRSPLWSNQYPPIGARRNARLSQVLRTSLLNHQRAQHQRYQRGVRYLTTSTVGTLNNPSSFVSRQLKPRFYVAFAGLGLGTAIAFAPAFKNTREGLRTGWDWNKQGDNYARRLGSAWVWQFWIGLTGLVAGMSATRGILAKSINQKVHGSWMIPFKIPLSVFGGVLGAELTISTAGPVAEAVVYIGRLAEFAADGLAADIFGKPRSELSWVIQQEQRALDEVKQMSNKAIQGGVA